MTTELTECPSENFLKNYSNSCYIDSFLVALFNNKNPFIEKEFLKADLKIYEIENSETRIIDDFNLNNIITSGNTISSLLQEIYKNIHSATIDRCYTLRSELQKFYNSINSKNMNDSNSKKFMNKQQDLNELFELFNNIFNFRKTLHFRGSNDSKEFNFLENDFKTDADLSSKNIEDRYKENYIKSSILYIPINQLDISKSSGKYSYGYNISPTIQKKDIGKIPQTLQLLNNKFKLILNSIIFYFGKDGSSGHYICVYKCGNNWFKYDDMKPNKETIPYTDIESYIDHTNNNNYYVKGLFYIPEFNRNNLNWFREILKQFNNEINKFYLKDNNYLKLNYNGQSIIIDNDYNIIEILRDIVNDDDVVDKLIFESNYNTPDLFLPLFIKKILKKNSIIIDSDDKDYYFNSPINYDYNLNTNYYFLSNKIIKLYKSNYIIFYKCNKDADLNIYRNNYNIKLNNLSNDYFKNFFSINTTTNELEIKNINYTDKEYKIKFDNYENEIIIKEYNVISPTYLNTNLMNFFKKDYINFINNKNINIYEVIDKLSDKSDNLSDKTDFFKYKNKIIDEIFNNQKNIDKERERLSRIIDKVLTNDRILEINSNNSERIKFLDDTDNTCISSFLFAILNRKNKYIEKYFLNANINTNNNINIQSYAKKIQKEFKIIYNFLTTDSENNNINVINKIDDVNTYYKVNKIIEYINNIIELNNINNNFNFNESKENLNQLINLLYNLYEIENINYDESDNLIPIFDLTDKNNYNNRILNIYKIKNAKLIFRKLFHEINDNELILYVSKPLISNKILLNDLYLNTIIIYDKDKNKYIHIYMNNDKFYYLNKEITNIQITLLHNYNGLKYIMANIKLDFFYNNKITIKTEDKNDGEFYKITNLEFYGYYSDL